MSVTAILVAGAGCKTRLFDWLDAPDAGVGDLGCRFCVDSVTPADGWQNGGDWLIVRGAGFAPGLRVFIGDGRAPALVLDSHTARVLTPPGPLGAHDVSVVLGGDQARLARGFAYRAGGLGASWTRHAMSSVRSEAPAVAVLQDGRLLIAGGSMVPDSPKDTLDTIDLFDPATGAVTPVAGRMATRRWRGSAVTLLDGRVLLVGGACLNALDDCVGDARLADLYDPATGTVRATASPLNHARSATLAVLLPDGRVLITSATEATAEAYDPASDAFTLLPLSQTHPFGFMVRLRDGAVLVGGGASIDRPSVAPVAAVDRFDPDTNTFSAVGPLGQPRKLATAATLPSGEVILVGGSGAEGSCISPLASVELFDPVASQWHTAPYHLASARCWHAGALTRNATVVTVGGYVSGYCGSLPTTVVEEVDPAAGMVRTLGNLADATAEWNAVTLHDGSFVAVGGATCRSPAITPNLMVLPAAP